MPATSTSLANQLLVALPSLADPNFARSVALICQYDEDGAMGVVVNRPSEFTLGDVFEQMGIETDDDELAAQPVLAGGPVHAERGFVLHDGEKEWDSSLVIGEGLYVTTSRDVLEAMARGEGPARSTVALGCAGWGGQAEGGVFLQDGEKGVDSGLVVGEGLYVTTSRDVLEAMARGEGPARSTVALGCAGWGAGQLEYELTENSWLTVPADAELLFATPLDARWQAAAGRLGVDMTRVADYSGHA